MFKKFNKFFLGKLTFLDTHTKEVVLKSTSSSFVKIIGMIISVLVSISLGRLLGAEGLGVINLGNRIINILIVFGLFGMRQVIIKEVAIANSNNNEKQVSDVMHSVYWFNGVVTLLISVCVILLSPYIAENIFNEPRLKYPLSLFLIALTPQVFSRLFASGLIGYKRIWQSNLVEQTLSIAITGTLLLVLWFIGYQISINTVAILFVIGRITVTISIGFYWKRVHKKVWKPDFIISKMLKTSVPMFLISISGIIGGNADVIILGSFVEVREVGLYTVAAKIALLTSFFLQITNSVLSPKIAALYKQDKVKELEEMVQKVTRGLSFIGISTMIIFIVLGENILSIWGEEFTNGYYVLLIIAVGQLVNLGTGAVGVIMIMTGFEKFQSNISVLFAIINIVLNIGLIYLYGAIGAAIATSLVLIGSNVTKVIYVKKLTRINPII